MPVRGTRGGVTRKTTRRVASVSLATAVLGCLGAVGTLVARSESASGHSPAPPPPTHTAAPVTSTATAPVHRRRHTHTKPVPPAPAGQPVPILMYHVIGSPPPGAPYPGLFVSPAQFRGQMLWLRAHDYHPVTLTQLWAYRHGGRLPIHPIVLTFDDGYRGDYSVAMPLLHRLGWPGVLNLLVANLHRHGWGLKTWEVRRMVADGWQIASHTLTHPDLTTVSAAQLYQEVTVSRRVLQRLFGQPVKFFCYPAGAYDQTVIDAVQRAGYLGATTELPGDASVSSPPDELPRIRISNTTTVADLAAALASG
jgi:peptidoglycan/xylan/chitin deacetylase (PgdA/CDA1 family)